MGIPGAGLPGFPGLSPMASPLSLRPTGSFVPPTFQANLTPKVRLIPFLLASNCDLKTKK